MNEIRVVQTEVENSVEIIKSIINDLEDLESVINSMSKLLNKSEGEFVDELVKLLLDEKMLLMASISMFSEFASTIGIAIDSFKKQDEISAKDIGTRIEME